MSSLKCKSGLWTWEQWRRPLAVSLLLVTFAAGLALFWRVRPVLLPFGLALVITYVLAPSVEALARRGLARPWAILVLYALLGLALAGLIIWVAPAVMNEVQRLAEGIPTYAAEVRSFLADWEHQYRRLNLPEGVRGSIDEYIGALQSRATSLTGRVLAGTFEAVEWLYAIILAPILAFYVLRDLDYFKWRLETVLPRHGRHAIGQLLSRVDQVVAGFVRGQVLLACLVGGLATLAALLLRLRFAMLLGLVAGLFELIPYIGPVLGAVPAVLVGYLHSPLTGIKTLLAFILIQQLENTVFTPKIMGSSVGLHPLAVVLAISTGGYLFGLAGLVLALPVAGVIRVLWSFTWEHLT